MTRVESKTALELVQEKIQSLKDWVVKNHNNPYTSKVSADLRSLEAERDYLQKLSLKTYPSVNEVAEATEKELLTMMRDLPAPSTPQEVTIFNKIKHRINTYYK